ncbi:MAG: PKD domain-containing protein [Bacteroidia bacterium]
MKNLFFTAALFISLLANASEINHQFSPNKNIITKVNVAVYFVTQNPENYDWVKWDFGDGQMEYAINPAHKYTKPGVYDVKMIVSKGSHLDTICKKSMITIIPKTITLEQGDYANDNDLSTETILSKQTPEIGNDLSDNIIRIANKASDNGMFEIRNSNGNLLYQTSIESTETIKNIETNSLNSGIYVVYLILKNKTYVAKYCKP